MDNSILDMLMGGQEDSSVMLESDADRAFIVLAALKESCTPEEFEQYTKDAAALELFQVVPNATAAMEAVEKRITKITRQSKLTQATKVTCMRMAKENGDPNYEKYKKYRALMVEFRTKIYNKYQNKATRVARQIVSGAKHNAAAMKTPAGRGISDKLEKTVKKIEREGVKTKK